MDYRHEYPVDLTADQHVDVIRAYAEYFDTRFKMVRNIFPAYKKPDGHWEKFDSYQAANAFDAERAFQLPIESLPASLDRLGGIGRVKDQRRLYALLQNFCESIDWEVLTPEQIARQLKDGLKGDGALLPLGDIDDALLNAVKKKTSAYWLQRSLNNDGQVITWTGHQPRLSADIPDESKLIKKNGETLLNDPEMIEQALVDSAKLHYMRPEMFVNAVHTHFHNKNLALKLHGEPGSVEKLSDATRDYLLSVLEAYREKGRNFLSEVAREGLQIAYRPLNKDTRSLTPDEGIEMLKRSLKKKPTPAASISPAEPLNNKKLDMLEKLGVKKQVDEWQKAVSGLANEISVEKKEPLLDSLSSLTSDTSELLSRSIVDAKAVLSQVEITFGPLVTSAVKEKHDQLVERMSLWLTEREEGYKSQFITAFERELALLMNVSSSAPQQLLLLKGMEREMTPALLSRQEQVFQKTGKLEFLEKEPPNLPLSNNRKISTESPEHALARRSR